MSDDTTPVNYSAMYDPSGAPLSNPVPVPTTDPADAVPTTDPADAVSATDPADAVPTTDPADAVTDSPETFVMVNLDSVGRVRLRAKPFLDSDVMTTFANGELLKVINADDSEWVFVEATVDGAPARGYIKKQFVAETPAPSSV